MEMYTNTEIQMECCTQIQIAVQIEMYTNAQVQLEMLHTNADRSTNGNVNTSTDRSTARNGHQWALMILGKATDKYKYKMNTIADT